MPRSDLYVGMTNILISRTSTHREAVIGTFTARYGIRRRVYFEYFRYVRPRSPARKS